MRACACARTHACAGLVGGKRGQQAAEGVSLWGLRSPGWAGQSFSPTLHPKGPWGWGAEQSWDGGVGAISPSLVLRGF